MRILVLNAGSSSLKFQCFQLERDALRRGPGGTVKAIGERALLHWRGDTDGAPEPIAASTPDQAMMSVLDVLARRVDRHWAEGIDAVAHRIVHGGEIFADAVRLTTPRLRQLEALNDLAPLHNPPALKLVAASAQRFGHDVAQIAVFDTAFFRSLPEVARRYALPASWYTAHRVQRYGFHGLAHRSLLEAYCAHIGRGPASTRVISFQLGHGCSAAAIQDGQALDTSMGFTPLEGLVMSSRPGDVDVGAVLHLMAQQDWTVDQVRRALYRNAGLVGVSGVSADMQELLALAHDGHEAAKLAVDMFCQRARKYLAAYLAVLAGADAILFGGGIGEHSPEIRGRICERMDWCGIQIDSAANARAVGVAARLSSAHSAIDVFTFPVDEESIIARDALRVLTTPEKE